MTRFTQLCLPLCLVLPGQVVMASGPGHHPNCIGSICFDSDQLSYLVAPEGIRKRLLDHEPDGEMNGRVLHARTDFNGDGITDIAVFELKGKSLKKMHSSYQVYFGTVSDSGDVSYPTSASTQVDSQGIPFNLIIEDFNNDQLLDFTMMVIDPGLVKSVGMLFSSLLSKSISLDLELYPLSDDGFTPDPAAVRKVKTISLGEPGEQAAIFPEVSFEDLTGDGQADLMVQTGPDQFAYYPAGTGDQLFAKRPRAYDAVAQNE